MTQAGPDNKSPLRLIENHPENGLAQQILDRLGNRSLPATRGMVMEALVPTLLTRCRELNFKSLARDIEPFVIKTQDIDRVILFEECVKDSLHTGRV